MRRKALYLGMAMVLVFTMFLTGCGGGSSAPTTAAPTTAAPSEPANQEKKIIVLIRVIRAIRGSVEILFCIHSVVRTLLFFLLTAHHGRSGPRRWFG